MLKKTWDFSKATIASMFESWPNNHRGLRKKVAQAILTQPNETIICALEGAYLPHGGNDAMWLTLTLTGGTVTRTRTLYRGEPTIFTRSLTTGEALLIRDQLTQLGAWHLPHHKQLIRDGWICAIAIADQTRLHSIQTHGPEGQQLALITYLLGLLPLDR
jgi:hypothetical protein